MRYNGKRLKLKNIYLLFLAFCLMLCPIQVKDVYAAYSDTIYNGVDYSLVYNKDYYYSKNPDLQRAIGNNSAALLKHFVQNGMKEGRQAKETFDISYYKYKNPDLQKAFGNHYELYYSHYMTYGYREGRQGYSYSFYNGVDYSLIYDKNFYYNKYPDLQRFIGNNPTELIKHFLSNGMKEGRQAKDTFDMNYYRLIYSDLQRAFGNNYSSYYQHYMSYGYREGRQAFSYSFYDGVDYSSVYDKNYYYNQYSDLQRVIGNNPTKLIKHFVENGMREGRQAKASFNVHQYRILYTDLQQAFGNYLEQYYFHYMNYGKNEGRRGTAIANGWLTVNSNKYYFSNNVMYTGWNTIEGRKYFFDSNGALKSLTGIDVSKYQGKIDWDKVKGDGIDFAIIRVGYGENLTSQDDATAIYNMSECTRLNIPFGVYLYSYALTQEQVNSEVAHTLRMIQGYNPSIGVFYDMEDQSQSSTLTVDQLNAFAYSYMSQIRNAGYKAGLYANKYWLTTYLTSNSLQEYLTWIANYGLTGNQSPAYNKPYQIWQYSSTGSVNGINGNVDLDVYLLP